MIFVVVVASTTVSVGAVLSSVCLASRIDRSVLNLRSVDVIVDVAVRSTVLSVVFVVVVVALPEVTYFVIVFQCVFVCVCGGTYFTQNDSRLFCLITFLTVATVTN